MRITYDPAKRDRTLRQHGLDFEQAPKVFVGLERTILDLLQDYGEDRYVTYGHLHGRMVAIVWTPHDEDERRVISMRKCNAKEQARYRERLREVGRDE